MLGTSEGRRRAEGVTGAASWIRLLAINLARPTSLDMSAVH